MIRVSEMFKTIQGEGTFTGRPVVFIRTSGCNLRCGWCDTPFASWDPEGDKMEVSLIVEKTMHLLGTSTEVVISGGEPMIQKDIMLLVDALKEEGCHITIETAGTIWWHNWAVDLWSISPKMLNSFPDKELHPKEYGIHERNLNFRKVILNIQNYINSGSDYQLKFVINDEGDIRDVISFIDEVEENEPKIPQNNIFLMPEGKTVEQLERSKMLCINTCMEHDYTYTGRLHIELWGDVRGK